MRVEAVSKFAHGPKLTVGFWMLTLNRLHLYLRLNSVASSALSHPVLVRAAEQQESTRGSHALDGGCVFVLTVPEEKIIACQKVLTAERVVSTDWVTHQHCPKIAPAKQAFTIT